MARQAAKRGIPVIIFDVTGGYGWENVGQHYADIDSFLFAARTTRGCLAIADETSQALDRWDRETYFLTTTIRHLGSKSILVSNRYRDLAVSIRENFRTIYCFRCTFQTQRALEDDYGELPQIPHFPDLQFIRIQPPEKPVIGTIDNTYTRVNMSIG
jgi:hypothetical protein